MQLQGLEVLRWAHGGDGVSTVSSGPLAGMIVFIEGAVPGDVVNVRVVKRKKSWAKALITSFVERSPARREAPCSVQASCGGCPWMSGSKDAQATSRLAILKGEAVKRLGWSETFASERVRLAPEVGGEFGYRVRLRLLYEVGPKGQVQVGFRAPRSNRLVPLSRCEVAHDALNQALPSLLEAISARERGQGEVQLLGSSDGVGAFIKPTHGGTWSWGEATLNLTLGKRLLTASPAHFFQANLEVTSSLVEAIERHIIPPDTHNRQAVEFFAGSGTLTGTLIDAGYEVSAYEVDAGAKALFEINTRGAEARFHISDLLDTGLPLPPPPSPRLILLDPPRVGAAELMPWIRSSGAIQVIMVSCDVSTAMRDLAMLQPRYDIAFIEGWNMFPHTGHQEVLAIATRSDSLAKA